MASPHSFTAVAVCGCGHDGRLGLGPSDANVGVPTLLPAFVPSPSQGGTADWAAASPPAVLAVACGGYHTIAITSEGLYGWGVNESGQLGLGVQVPSVSTPTRLAFFDKMSVAHVGRGTEEESAHPSHTERVVRVSCGGRHSFVLTTKALYACGANEAGQLGLGSGSGGGRGTLARDDCVHDWQLVCQFGGGARCPAHGGPDALLSPSSSSPHARPLFSLPPLVDIVKATVVDVSCGTDHTLLALEDVRTVGRRAGDGEADAEGDLSGVQWWPFMVLSAGKGDFGELGYDGSAEDVERARNLAKHAAALSAAMTTDRQGGGADVDAVPPGNGSHDPLYKFKMKHKAAVPRRPAFHSTFFRPVRFPASLVGAGAAEVLAPVVVSDGGDGESRREAAQAARRQGARRPQLLFLDASHLHSAVAVSHDDSGCSGSREGSQRACVTAVHWGCCYCDRVETLDASRPRPIAVAADGTRHQRVHGGNEVLFHYAAPSAPIEAGRVDDGGVPPCIHVEGKGVLGFGEEDDLVESPKAIPGTAGVTKVVGKEHFLLLQTRARHDGEGEERAVLGFGDNLHGQLGTADPTRCDEGEGEDRVLVPRVLIQRGDRLGGDWRVEDVRDVAAGARHSVFLVDVTHSPP